MNKNDDFLDGILAGLLLALGAVTAATCYVERKIVKENIIIDVVNKELRIKCKSGGIPLDSFSVWVHKEGKYPILHVVGSVTAKEDIETCKHKYRIKNVLDDDFGKLSWDIEEKYLIVKIPLSEISNKISVRQIR